MEQLLQNMKLVKLNRTWLLKRLIRGISNSDIFYFIFVLEMQISLKIKSIENQIEVLIDSFDLSS